MEDRRTPCRVCTLLRSPDAECPKCKSDGTHRPKEWVRKALTELAPDHPTILRYVEGLEADRAELLGKIKTARKALRVSRQPTIK